MPSWPRLISDGARLEVNGRATFLTLFGQSVREASGTLTLDADRLGFDLEVLQQERRNGRLAGTVRLRDDRHAAELVDLTVTLGRAPWRLTPGGQTPVVSWNDEGVSVTAVEFTDGNNDERIGLSGTWRRDGEGALRMTASHVFLDTLQSAFDRPTRYGGVLDLDATLRGTVERPRVAATLTVSNGRVERVSYQKLQGQRGLRPQMLRVDLRLDQAPGVWLTAVGTVPTGCSTATCRTSRSTSPSSPARSTWAHRRSHRCDPERQRRDEAGREGDRHQPRSAPGRVGRHRERGVSGDRHRRKYKNGRAAVKLSRDRMTVDTLHLEDSDGQPLDVHGSLATHELRVGDLEIEARAQHFEVMRNQLGQVDIDATLQLRGQFESPRIAGEHDDQQRRPQGRRDPRASALPALFHRTDADQRHRRRRCPQSLGAPRPRHRTPRSQHRCA